MQNNDVHAAVFWANRRIRADNKSIINAHTKTRLIAVFDFNICPDFNTEIRPNTIHVAFVNLSFRGRYAAVMALVAATQIAITIIDTIRLI
jgi:hypothetical protein